MVQARFASASAQAWKAYPTVFCERSETSWRMPWRLTLLASVEKATGKPCGACLWLAQARRGARHELILKPSNAHERCHWLKVEAVADNHFYYQVVGALGHADTDAGIEFPFW